MKQKRRMGASGFSLIELIAAIAVLVILVGILTPNLLRYVQKSREAKDIQAADSAVEAAKFKFTEGVILANAQASTTTTTFLFNGSTRQAQVPGDTTSPSIEGYGLSKKELHHQISGVDVKGIPSNAYVRVDLNKDGQVANIMWVATDAANTKAINWDGKPIDGWDQANVYYSSAQGTLYLGSPYESGSVAYDSAWKRQFFDQEGHTSSDIQKITVSPGTTFLNDSLAGLFSASWQANADGRLGSSKWHETAYTMKDLQELDLTYLPSTAKFNGKSKSNYTDPTSIASLKTMTLPEAVNQQGIPLTYGSWYYYDSNGNKQTVPTEKSGVKMQYSSTGEVDQLRITAAAAKELAGKTIYRND